MKFIYKALIFFFLFVQTTIAMNPDKLEKNLADLNSRIVFFKPNACEDPQKNFINHADGSFSFVSQSGKWNKRSVSDYQIINQPLYDQVSSKKALILGGMHLLPEQAFQLSKKYAKEGKLDLMINGGVSMHEGHTVINLDPDTHPDYSRDFTEAGLIPSLKLTGKFEFVVFENIKPSLSLNLESLKNAWEALLPGGKIIIYPAHPLHENYLKTAGFISYNFKDTGYKNVFRDVTLCCPACVAVKPKEEAVFSTK